MRWLGGGFHGTRRAVLWLLWLWRRSGTRCTWRSSAVHPELDDFELTAAPDDLYIVTELLDSEEALVRRSIPEVWLVVWQLRR